ncbi:MAG: hypothetical protein ACXWKH_20205 [Limisphaerales bacterium]
MNIFGEPLGYHHPYIGDPLPTYAPTFIPAPQPPQPQISVFPLVVRVPTDETIQLRAEIALLRAEIQQLRDAVKELIDRKP